MVQMVREGAEILHMRWKFGGFLGAIAGISLARLLPRVNVNDLSWNGVIYGPVAVTGARPGHVLEVAIEEVRLPDAMRPSPAALRAIRRHHLDRCAAARSGLDLSDMELALEGGTHMEEIEQNHADLEASGHWGVPTFVIRGEPFFGQDRIDTLCWRLDQLGLKKKP